MRPLSLAYSIRSLPCLGFTAGTVEGQSQAIPGKVISLPSSLSHGKMPKVPRSSDGTDGLKQTVGAKPSMAELDTL